MSLVRLDGVKDVVYLHNSAQIITMHILCLQQHYEDELLCLVEVKHRLAIVASKTTVNRTKMLCKCRGTLENFLSGGWLKFMLCFDSTSIHDFVSSTLFSYTMTTSV